MSLILQNLMTMAMAHGSIMTDPTTTGEERAESRSLLDQAGAVALSYIVGRQTIIDAMTQRLRDQEGIISDLKTEVRDLECEVQDLHAQATMDAMGR